MTRSWAYYNEFDPQAAAWLRELIKAGHIAPGEVDERSIANVKADDLRGFTQCHFFAGIGGWSRALRLAGWADDRPCWTGSPPCQPFSNAGKQKAQSDARHLWPVFFGLIRECRPANIFGEQVEAAIRTGWLDDLQDDLEAENYATGKIVLPACSVGAPHIRQRIYFIADRLSDPGESRSQRQFGDGDNSNESGRINSDKTGSAAEGCEFNRVADSQASERGGARISTNSGRRSEKAGGYDNSCGLAVPDRTGLQSRQGNDEGERHRNTSSSESCDDRCKLPGPTNGFWKNVDWLFCRDGKWRPAPTECKFLLLADGFWYRMDDVLSELITKAIQGVEEYAEITRTRPEEVLRSLWEADRTEAVQRETARPWSVFKDEVLWAILRGKGSMGEKPKSEHTGQQKKITEADRRMLRDLQSQIESEYPPLRRKSAEQRQSEFTNPVSELPQFLAQCEQAYESYGARKNEGGFPLAGKCLGRVGLLHGYGNAIVAEQAAEFIRAYMSARSTYHGET